MLVKKLLSRNSRGQTLIEMVVAMPIVLLALFGIIYVSRFGVVNERAELALRYGSIDVFDAGSNQYSAANIYSNLSGIVPACPTPPVSILTGTGPFPGPTSAPIWQPDSDVAKTSGCTAGTYGFGGSQFIASHFFAESTSSISAGIDVPYYLQKLIGSHTTAATSASFLHAAYPAIILYCSTEVTNRVDGAITASGSSIPPTPIPDGSPQGTPPPDNGHCD